MKPPPASSATDGTISRSTPPSYGTDGAAGPGQSDVRLGRTDSTSSRMPSPIASAGQTTDRSNAGQELTDEEGTAEQDEEQADDHAGPPTIARRSRRVGAQDAGPAAPGGLVAPPVSAGPPAIGTTEPSGPTQPPGGTGSRRWRRGDGPAGRASQPTGASGTTMAMTM